MNIIIIHPSTFPNGFGITVFLSNIIKALTFHGKHNITLFCSGSVPRDYENFSEEKKNALGNPEVIYCQRKTIQNKILQKIKSILILPGLILHIRRKASFPNTGILLLGPYPLLAPCLRLCGFKIVSYRGEYPNCGRKITWRHSFLYISEILWANRFYSGMLVATKTLEAYFKKIASPSCRFLVTRLIVDMKQFIPEAEPDSEYITYCGDFSGNKDGVEKLIQIIQAVSAKYPQVKLKLIGFADSARIKELQDQVAQSNLKPEQVVFTGALPHDQVIPLLQQAKVLVLSRPNNRQAQGGFPSKLGEYLATGKPVLATAVGEIPEVFRNGEDIFLVPSDDNDAFIEKLVEILENYDHALEVGRKGRKTISLQYDFPAVEKQVSAFIEMIYKNE